MIKTCERDTAGNVRCLQIEVSVHELKTTLYYLTIHNIDRSLCICSREYERDPMTDI